MKQNKGVILIAGFLMVLLLFSINFNELTDSSNYSSYIGIIGLIAFILVKSNK